MTPPAAGAPIRAVRPSPAAWLVGVWLGLAGPVSAPAETAPRPVSLRDAALLMSGQVGGDLEVGLATLQSRGTVVALVSVSRPSAVPAGVEDTRSAQDACIAEMTAYVLDTGDAVVGSRRMDANPCTPARAAAPFRGLSVPLSWRLASGSYRVRVLVRQPDAFAIIERAIEVDTSRAQGWLAIETGWAIEVDPADPDLPFELPDGATALPVIEAGTRLHLATLDSAASEPLWATDARGHSTRLASLGSASSAGWPARGGWRPIELDTSTLTAGKHALRRDAASSPLLMLDLLAASAPDAARRSTPAEPALPGDEKTATTAVVDGYRDALSRWVDGSHDEALDALHQLETALVSTQGDAAYDVIEAAVGQIAGTVPSCPECRLPLALVFADLARCYDEARWAALASVARGRARGWAEDLASTGDADLGRHAGRLIAQVAEDLQRSGRYERATEHFDQALVFAPDLFAPRALLAALHEKHGRYREVVRTLAPIADHPALDDASRLRLAINQARIGQTRRSREQLTRLVDAATPWIAALAWQERIRLAIDAEAWQEAREHLRTALLRWPGQANLSVLDGWMHARTAGATAAHQQLGTPMRDHPEVDDARYRYHRWPEGLLDPDRRDLERAAEAWLPRLAGALAAAQEEVAER